MNSTDPRLRLKAEFEQLQQELALLREEIRIKDARMAQIAPHRRPHFPPTERMAILELRAARCWSLEQTARAFLVTAATAASWLKRVDEQGTEALVQLREPVNKFPDFVAHLVQRLKTLCPRMGKVKIAQTLARAGLHLGVTSVQRMLRRKPGPVSARSKAADGLSQRTVTANYPNHIWHVDLTLVATMAGFWTTWLPGAMPQCWPFGWWVGVTLDHLSRSSSARMR